MADPETAPQPETDADLVPPPADTSFEPAEPLKTESAAFDPATDGGSVQPATASDRAQEAGTAIREGVSNIGQQAADRARLFAEDGKARAGDALDQLSRLLGDAAGQVDGKLGAQYGDYARQAAGSVQSFADTVRGKDVDELIAQAGDLVRKSPAAAVGIAAAFGFAVARLIQSGLDQRA